MRTTIGALLLILCATQAVAADGTALERAWHGCVREAFSDQPRERSRAAAQRSALDACRAEEDATVAALMAERGEAGRTPLSRARAWVASVVDPVAAWLGALRR